MSTRILAGRYELLERIGSGGMAVVYKSRDRLLNRYVAIKILKPEFTKDVKFIENFRKESQAAASLSHPNIVNVYDVGREGSIHYIVMELIEGEALSDLIAREAPLDYRLVIDITKQIASALSFAHKHQIIHRDVKPHNIMITASGTAKITDFGIAKAVNNATVVGNTGTVMGSVHYFSPEQARGGYVDEKSDIYSLGIVMYEMLTGRVPFDGENPVAVALMHINEDIVPPSKLVNGIPPRLEQIVMKATNKIQINRYKTADEMLDALNNLEFVSSIVGDSALSGTAGVYSVSNVNPYNAETAGSYSVAGASHAAGTSAHAADGAAYYRDAATAETAGAAGGAAANTAGSDGSKHGKKKEKKPHKINKITVLAVIAALICALPVSNLIASGIGSLGKTKTVEVPDLTGYTVSEAEAELEELGLELEEGDKVISEYDEGLIVSQDPEEGTKVKKGKTITVNISKGVREGTVPKLVGSSLSDAEYILDKYNYKLGNVTYEASSLPEGVVVSQDPEAGVERSAGSYVNIVVSEGEDDSEAVMPSLLGKSLEDAKEAIESAGLAVGEISYGVSSAYDDNEVMWQEYDADKKLAKGTTVNIKVSRIDEGDGEDGEGSEATESKSVALHISYDLAENQVFYLTVTVSDDEGTHNIISNQQRTKDAGSETVTLTGSGSGTVTVIIDNNVVMKKNVDFNTGELS